MKKKKLVIYLVIMVMLVCSSCSCSNKTDAPQNDDESFSTVSSDKVSVESMGYIGKTLIAKMTNNNSKEVWVSTVYATFKDKEGNYGFEQRAPLLDFCIPSKGSLIIFFDARQQKSDDYVKFPEVSFNTSLLDPKDDYIYDGIEVSSKDTGNDITITYKNNTEYTVDSSKSCIVFYNGGEISQIGIAIDSDWNTTIIPGGGVDYTNYNYTYENGEKVPFDKYEIYYLGSSKGGKTLDGISPAISMDKVEFEPQGFDKTNLRVKVTNNNDEIIHLQDVKGYFWDNNNNFGFKKINSGILNVENIPPHESVIVLLEGRHHGEDYEKYPVITFTGRFVPYEKMDGVADY